jgi:alkanesulfonate monooxygenase SsuD/methylene tetrahydromethanopterin reductase-like flavin-dependent oxidoreductase (luciferase family)
VIPTVNPAAYLPYTAARQFATLQHLSAGRLGLNVVTDTGSARHFGDAPALGHDAAYDRAEEWLAGIRALWASWGEGALVRDASSGVYADGTGWMPRSTAARTSRSTDRSTRSRSRRSASL